MLVLFAILLILFPGISEGLKIGFTLATEKEERYKKDKKYFFEKARELGVEVIYGNAQNSHDRQEKIVLDMIKKGVQVIVIQPVDSDRSASFVSLAHKKGVKVVSYDRLIYNAPVDWYVTHDSFMAGVLQAKYAIKKTGGKGIFIILAGDKNHSVARMITSGNLYILMSYKVKVGDIVYHKNWSEKESYESMKKLIRKWNGEISAVLANNSALARGAVRALREAGMLGKNRPFIAGVDADLENCRWIVQGIQDLEILKEIKPLAYKAVEIAVKLARGQEPEHSKIIENGKFKVKATFIPVRAVTRSNIRQIMEETRFHDIKEIFRNDEIGN